MQDAYVQVFQSCVQRTREQTGIELPTHIEHYVVALLATHIDRPDFLPKKTFAELILTLDSRKNAKYIGDTCLFLTGVFPTYGINKRYYSDIGRTAYSTIELELFQTIVHSFDTIQTLIDYTVNRNRASLVRELDI
jgi:hypothetical protein